MAFETFPSFYSTCQPYGGGLATIWNHVYNFADEWEWTCYWFGSTTRGNGLAQWNEAQAIKLIVNKIDAMQDQIDALSGGGDVTMAAILTAMVTATYDELTQFVGIEDAYRSAIWDQPFNAQFYAALANGFRR